MTVAALAGTKTLWYATRGTGIVALLLLTASVVLGTLSSARWQTARMPRFLVGALHRNLTLLAVAFVAVHVVTAVADRFAPIGLQDGLLPFLSPYRPIWLGLGTVAFDLLLALVITSLLRAQLGFRFWRGVHWLAYASWPVAVLHSLGTGSDAKLGWMALVGVGTCVLVVAALLVRVARSEAGSGIRMTAVAATCAVPLALLVWYLNGPAAAGWARRAGTPAALLRHRVTSTRELAAAAPVQRSLPSGSFDGQLSGGIQQGTDTNGLIRINIATALRGTVTGKLRITLWGQPTEGEGVALAASDVAFAARGTTEAYVGHVVALDGNHVEAQLQNASGARLDLAVDLNLANGRGAVTGDLHGRAA